MYHGEFEAALTEDWLSKKLSSSPAPVAKASPSLGCRMPSPMHNVNIPSHKWTHSFLLPSHYAVGPTACEPALDASTIRQVPVTGLPLPVAEEFGPDAFNGKCFVRMPRRTEQQTRISGRVARLRREQPSLGSESMWLPDYCIVSANTFEIVRQQKRA